MATEKRYFRNKKRMEYRESLFFCGCESCVTAIKEYEADGIPYQTGFLNYVSKRYPETFAKVNNK